MPAIRHSGVRESVANEDLASDPSMLKKPPLASRSVQLAAYETGTAAVHLAQVITVGDEVEVFGKVQLSPDPLADDGYRGSRLGVTLRPGTKVPLAIRLVRRARGA
jgi:hypothetical protein